jgi:hypothetical protein
MRADGGLSLNPLARYDLLLARGEAQRRAGNVIGAFDTLRTAAGEASMQGAPEQLARAAVAFEETNFWLGSSGDEALELVERAEETLHVEDSTLRALTVASLSRAPTPAAASRESSGARRPSPWRSGWATRLPASPSCSGRPGRA